MFSRPMVERNALYNQERIGSWESQLPSDELGVMVQGAVGGKGGEWWRKAGSSSATRIAESFIILGVSSL